ncbi:uroporphyrinogen-III synthase [Flavobacterium sp. CYK-55]|uniref:uroporphyrinogen-III synthase n=1 Tax=Flavobacterium sp. CYK-55 TaxID=2835529 RepID=UPI001BCF3038|nr:uroporphyrinogen-III synthase [Flavobacterium sp. CYK-55]MBS7787572.1 uroporphyrinogen-III synthase [Flavobacterium sp. CYK-55]
MTAAVRILSTKKLSAGQRQYLLNAGFSVSEADFIQTEPVHFSLNAPYNALIFTSQKAVESLLQSSYTSLLTELPCFCVGEKTQSLLEKNQAQVVAVAVNAAALAQKITADFRAHRFAFFCGDLRRDELPNLLSEHQISLDEIQVYRTRLTPHKITSEPNALLFFSPSAVESYLQNNPLTEAVCFCIGSTTAAALNNHTNPIITATKPTIENTIIQVLQYYRNPQA